MMKSGKVPLALGVLLVFSALPLVAAPPSAQGLRNDMRKLWEDHITWTRLYIVSAAANLPNKDATAQRL
ncbi:MAG TPA: hypothetical protein VFE84_11010, partial [Patescibacteria group bacterium]|nr:hypothetical protein [Patescibacteria group bacterium]